jgi:hypothetical protein
MQFPSVYRISARRLLQDKLDVFAAPFPVEFSAPPALRRFVNEMKSLSELI